jgi:hypothetical protein
MEYPVEAIFKDAWYFLEERLPAFSVFYVDGGYTISGGVYIMRSLRKEFFDLKSKYRD